MTSSSHDRDSGAILASLSDEALEKLEEDGSSNSGFNSAAFSFALSWIRAGGGKDGYVETVSQSTLGQSYPRSDIDRRLSQTFDDALNKVDYSGGYGHHKGDLVDQLKLFRLNVEKSSEIKSSVKPTALALIDTGISIGAWSVSASSRTLAEATGLSHRTVSRHLNYLKSTPLVSRVTLNGTGYGRTFHLNLNYRAPKSDTVGHNNVYTNDTYYDLQVLMCDKSVHHLLWSKHGLGGTARRLYGALGAKPATKAGLSKASGLHRQTVERHLSRLVEVGLVAKLEASGYPRYALNLCPDIEHVLLEIGAQESLELQRIEHERQRNEFEELRGATLRRYLEAGMFPAPLNGTTEQRRDFKLTKAGLDYLRSERPNWYRSDKVPEKFRDYVPDRDPFDPESDKAIDDWYIGTKPEVWNTNFLMDSNGNLHGINPAEILGKWAHIEQERER